MANCYCVAPLGLKLHKLSCCEMSTMELTGSQDTFLLVLFSNCFAQVLKDDMQIVKRIHHFLACLVRIAEAWHLNVFPPGYPKERKQFRQYSHSNCNPGCGRNAWPSSPGRAFGSTFHAPPLRLEAHWRHISEGSIRRPDARKVFHGGSKFPQVLWSWDHRREDLRWQEKHWHLECRLLA